MTNYQDSRRFMDGTSTTEPISLGSQKSAYDREIEGTRYEVTPSKKKTPMAARQIDCVNALAPDISPAGDSQPFLPLLAPSQLTPFTNNTVLILSGLCTLNFIAAESAMSISAIECCVEYSNVVCCPQLNATLVIIIRQSSKYSGSLALNRPHASHCLSDVEKIPESKGGNEDLQNICSFHPENLTEASCPLTDVDEFEHTVDSSRLLDACCQNAVLDVATIIAQNSISNMDGVPGGRIDDCKNLSSGVCPLVFPKMTNVWKECGNVISNQTACCKAMESYVYQLQRQSFLTNLQALNCAVSLGMMLQKANVSHNVYSLCHINLKDFSLQESGCLLPTLPSDATYDRTSGIGFVCDLNDNIEAPCPSKSNVPTSTCNTNMFLDLMEIAATKLPAISAAASAQSGKGIIRTLLYLNKSSSSSCFFLQWQ
ncbi:hypothetical protein CIPAW_04G116400 [Carya illinoinensis]|uniref:SPARK domain-containing protein n=1 Tax=Carya illinoinensis TaxID=32201 RepID=A0A8T1QUJ1_CARIL|nr:hypothetical protein CIPAW_04G116400 [Carya illinoinensis]